MATALVILTATIVGLTAAWWWWTRSRTAELEPDWRGVVRVLAGDGVAAFRDGEPFQARFSDPFDVASAPDGTVYVADAGESQRIRRVSADGRVTTLAGGIRGFTDGAGPDARFDTPSGLAVGRDGSVYVADTGNNAIRRITPEGYVTTLAGDGTAGYQDGPGRAARFNAPVGVAVDPAGRVVVADTYNDRIRAIGPEGGVTTLAGSGEPGFLDGEGTLARFDTPCDVAIDGAGNVLVADTGNGLVRMIGPQGTVVTAAAAMGATLFRPVGIAATPAGDAYVTDERGRIVEMRSDGSVRTIAGATPGFSDGPAGDARFRRPTGLTVAAPGRLLVADAGNALIRTISAVTRGELAVPPSPLIRPHFDVRSFGSTPLLWPVGPMDGPHEVAGTMGEARGMEGSERFHSGVDVRVTDGTPVLAARDGVVSSPISTDEFGSLNEWLRIGAVTYVHVRAGRAGSNALFDLERFVPTYDATGALIRVRLKRGARFTTGEAVASVNRFNHVHLNVGWPGEEQNPLRFRLPSFEDTVRPTIARGGVRLYDEYAQPIVARARRRLLVSGRVQVVVDAWDQVDGNRPGRRLGLHSLGYQVLDADGAPAPGFETPRDTIRFDVLSPQPDAARLVYAPGSGIPFYGRRVTRFLYIVTNTFRQGAAAEGFWDTTLLRPGDYTLRVHAADFEGNAALANRDLPVTVVLQ